MNETTIIDRLESLIRTHPAREVLMTDPHVRSTLVDREDMVKVYSLRLEHMPKAKSTERGVQHAIQDFIDASAAISDRQIRLTLFNNSRTHFAAFTDQDVHHLLGLIGIETP